MRNLRKLFAALLCLTLLFGCLSAQAVEITIEGEDGVQEVLESGEADSDAVAENAAELTPEEEALMAELAGQLEDATMDGEVDLSNLEPNEKLPDNVMNILLLGVDNRSVELESGRSDAVIICSVNLNTGAITLTSIARDTAVVVPGYKNRQRINVAFKFGSKDGVIAHGAELAMKTVNRNFLTNIERYVVVNIHGLADIIEALGGVDIELTKAEAQAINYELFVKEPMDKVEREKLLVEDGVQHLDGMEAVTYGRIRNLSGQNDLNRNGRQRVLLETLLRQVMADGMDIGKFLSLIETALPYGETNLTMDELLTLGLVVLGGETMEKVSEGGELVAQFGIPMEKQYGYKEFGGVSLIYISETRLKTTLTAWQELVYGQSYLDE